ncbi:MAG: hypothetical protein CMM74_07810 [Rhodospirillaceae bacterium]|nr:hypothetical protein [Rhodospirillaceae bacterium]
MLRVSTQKSGTEYDIQAALGNGRGDGEIPHGQLLADFAEAIAMRDEAGTAELRRQVADTMGEEALIDAAATAASFHGYVRIADATGLTADMAGGGQIPVEFREDIGVTEYYRAVNG